MPSKIAIIASSSEPAQAAYRELSERYEQVSTADADAIVALGGDGFMLQTVHETIGMGKPIFGMNRGTIGFLMNEYSPTNLLGRLDDAEALTLRPLRMRATGMDGRTVKSLAINEVSLLRETRQAAKLRIVIDGETRMAELVCDGILVATPAGSSAYNLSAHGPVIPLHSDLLALTPISAFRPRRWRGALLPHDVHIELEVLDGRKRPVSAVADQTEVRDVAKVVVEEDRNISYTLLFDPGHSLAERILLEQFVA
ncbi:MAG: NAD kinase [Alphaproteobacteria bacterium]|nr:MAG: NAD kinase [Alphaproteobacteria bacterium]